MRLADLTLQPCTARRIGRTHEGAVVAPVSNQRWASDGLNILCWDSETVHVAFVKKLKRDYVRVSPCPDALSVLKQLPNPENS